MESEFREYWQYKALISKLSYWVNKGVRDSYKIYDPLTMANQTINLGDGLYQDEDGCICVSKTGILRFEDPNTYWVEVLERKYVPRDGDNVLGVVVDIKKEHFLVDIKGPKLAVLPVLSFEGGTRRNIPKFEVGTLLYARVITSDCKETQLSCIGAPNEAKNPSAFFKANGKAAEYGILKEGYLFESSLVLSRVLLGSRPSPALEDLEKNLEKNLSFEIVVGINGRFWVNASQSSTVMLVGNALQESDSLIMHDDFEELRKAKSFLETRMNWNWMDYLNPE